MYSVVDIGRNQYVKSKFKVFHKISVLFGFFLYISLVSAYIQAISAHTYSVVDIGKSQYVKSKFKIFHKISVLFGYSLYISEVSAYIQAISPHTYSVVNIGKSQFVKSKFKVFHNSFGTFWILFSLYFRGFSIHSSYFLIYTLSSWHR